MHYDEDGNKVDVNPVLASMLSAIKLAFGPLRSYQFSLDTDSVGIRDWGEWVMPEGEEDDGDYDWEVPSADTLRKARANVDMLNAKIQQGWKFRLVVSEKNCFYLDLVKIK